MRTALGFSKSVLQQEEQEKNSRVYRPTVFALTRREIREAEESQRKPI